MAVAIISRVWEGYPGGGSELLALLALADWSDDAGRCYPSMAAIAKKTRLSESQARRVVHILIDQGFLDVTGNLHGGKPGTTRQYRIVLEKLTTSTHARGSGDARGSTHARDGSHPCAETASAHDTQTVIEPSITVKGEKSSPFDVFWMAYPVKKGKGAAQAAWKRAKLDNLLDEILKAITLQKCCDASWSKGFIPHPTTWINQKRWLDEIQETQAQEGERDYI